MANFTFPTKQDLENIISLLYSDQDDSIKKYLPIIDDNWFNSISSFFEYTKMIFEHKSDYNFYKVSAFIIYKIAKRHEFSDGNKRSSVISLFCFCLLNNYYIKSPQNIKNLAKRIASTKGRVNEDLIQKRISMELEKIIIKLD